MEPTRSQKCMHKGKEGGITLNAMYPDAMANPVAIDSNVINSGVIL